MHRSTRLVALSAVALVHCAPGAAGSGGATASPRPPASRAAASASASAVDASATKRDDGRLPDGIAPLRYRLALDVDPSTPRFEGVVSIDVRIAAPTREITLHGVDIHVARAVLKRGADEAAAHATPRTAPGGDEPEELVLTFDRDVAAGDATLEIAYDAPFSETLGGLYRVKEGDRWYAFTQFEATDARRAFPCFDEPGRKVPFEVSLRVPKGMLAFSNSAETARAPEGKKVAFRFAATPPLPTYLVAFAIGDFDVKSGPKSPVPIRLIATKGKGALGELALAEAAATTAALADYFGIAYPYGKLDLVAVPNLGAGAMENAGLITFREDVLLLDPKKASVHARQQLAVFAAHELAHQWFGDLVTMKWWNDLWLNEGFAAWMEALIVDTVHPSYEARLGDIAGVYEVMDTDAMSSARAVRQPVATSAEADEAFDGITYQKGAAVLGMIEAWLGPDVFKRGVRAYMKAHAHGNATADDLFAALSAASGRNVSATAATFLDRSGVPSIDVNVTCDKGQLTGIDLVQRAWTPLGAPASAGTETSTPWRIPVCLRIAGVREPKCVELTKTAERVAFAGAAAGTTTGATACPAWVYPNADEAGYYRFTLPEDGFLALAAHIDELDVGNKVGLLSNLWAQVRAGRVSSEVLLRVLPLFDRETDLHTVRAAIELLHEIRVALVDESAVPAFRAYAAARLAPHKKRLLDPGAKVAAAGSRAREHETILRQSVFFALGELAEDEATLKRADAMAKGWLANPAAADGDLAPTAVRLASRHADATRLVALRKMAREAKVPGDRTTALRAMFAFGDRALLEQALALTLTDEVKLQDFRYVWDGVKSHPSSHAVAYAWAKAHWKELRGKLKGRMGVELIEVAGATCTEAERADAEAFLQKNASDMEGASRAVAERLESLAICAALRAREGSNMARALTRDASGAAARHGGLARP